MEIQKFEIQKLHKTLNYSLELKDNVLILIGENGSCKTTIIKMLFYTLSLQWGKLAQYNFEKLAITINNKRTEITRKEISSTLFIDNPFLRRLPPQIRREILEIQENGNIDFNKIEIVSRRYDFPMEIILEGLNIQEDRDLFNLENKSGKQISQIKKKIKEIKESVAENHILYLPTYRRIEQELKVVLDGKIDESNYRSRGVNSSRLDGYKKPYTELIEFGMNDVDESVKRTLAELRNSFGTSLNQLTIGYLGDIVEEKYNNIDLSEIDNVDDETINNIMNRVDKSILSDESKLKLSQTLHLIKENGVKNEHDKVVSHYFLKLLTSHRELESKEANIRAFVDACDRYLQNKTVRYDSSNFGFSIVSNIDDEEIELYQLSSGEKQIVSLFGQLYLSKQQNYFVLIDEPELSLSVKWQKTFLEDVRNGDFCNGLVAVTHSPFIFDNELDQYARGLGEFIK